MSELNKAVADLLIKATEAAETAGKFAVEQLPDVAHQYVLLTGVWAIACVLLGLSILAILIWSSRWCYKNLHSSEKPFMMIPIILCVPAIIFTMENIRTALTAFLAPKVLLIQWAAELVK